MTFVALFWIQASALSMRSISHRSTPARISMDYANPTAGLPGTQPKTSILSEFVAEYREVPGFCYIKCFLFFSQLVWWKRFVRVDVVKLNDYECVIALICHCAKIKIAIGV